jgi:peptidoglycan/xylan/chitin deacetylase (PgdA/CDA1 family)
VKYRLIRLLAVLLLAATAICGPAGRDVRLVVVLGFDDSSADQFQVAQILESHAIRATFYVNSSLLGTSSYYMTWDQVQILAAAGNEIAGHTLTHRDLTTLEPDQQRHEICDDRESLVEHGLEPVSFAYPYGKSDATSAAIVGECGYTSGRTTGGLSTAYSCPAGCPEHPYTESMPPQDPYAIRAANLGPTELSLNALQEVVDDASRHRPGLLPLYFHNVCNAPCPGGFGWVQPITLAHFLDWLESQANRGTVVMTNQEALRLRLRTTEPPAGLPNEQHYL